MSTLRTLFFSVVSFHRPDTLWQSTRKCSTSWTVSLHQCWTRIVHLTASPLSFRVNKPCILIIEGWMVTGAGLDRLLEVKLSLCRPWSHTGAIRGIAPLILYLDTSLRCVISFTSRPLYPGGFGYLFCRRPDGLQSRFWRFEEVENFLPLPGIEPQSCRPLLVIGRSISPHEYVTSVCSLVEIRLNTFS